MERLLSLAIERATLASARPRRSFANVRIVFVSAALVLTSIALVPAIAHVLERPGKARLSRDGYLAVQTIYYPGFTVAGGVGEIGAFVATALLAFVTPPGVARMLTFVAFACLAGVHAIFWTVVQPINKHWLARQPLDRASARFFAAGGTTGGGWSELRDRWESAHAARAALELIALVALVVVARG